MAEDIIGPETPAKAELVRRRGLLDGAREVETREVVKAGGVAVRDCTVVSHEVGQIRAAGPAPRRPLSCRNRGQARDLAIRAAEDAAAAGFDFQMGACSPSSDGRSITMRCEVARTVHLDPDYEPVRRDPGDWRDQIESAKEPLSAGDYAPSSRPIEAPDIVVLPAAPRPGLLAGARNFLSRILQKVNPWRSK